MLNISGRSKARSVAVLSEMGPAVFNGGLSTFLAFILVAFSDSYVFQTFFKASQPFLVAYNLASLAFIQ
jgi:Niemann-Pick C1 protein